MRGAPVGPLFKNSSAGAVGHVEDGDAFVSSSVRAGRNERTDRRPLLAKAVEVSRLPVAESCERLPMERGLRILPRARGKLLQLGPPDPDLMSAN
jgi:hypothetical protein